MTDVWTQSVQDRKRLAGGRLGAVRENPRLRQQPGANSKPHHSEKAMPPSITAEHGNGQAADDGPVKLDLIWGEAAVGRVCNLSPRQAFYALETGSIPAKKVGGRWVAERGQLLSFFLGSGK